MEDKNTVLHGENPYKISFSEESSSKNGSILRFKIPIYQRPFAWKGGEVEILLEDLEDLFKDGKNKKENQEVYYYLGNIVVDKRKDTQGEYLEVIDGQQRLTVLYLLWAILGKRFNEKSPFELEYEIREEDNTFLKKLSELKDIDLEDEDFNKIQERITQLQKETEAHPNFVEVVNTILNWQKEKDKEGRISSRIKIAFGITAIPEGTDVARYFEVMNSRGKQLEQHQVLKARFLEKLKGETEIDYAKIWDYCSDMSVLLEDLIYSKK